MTPTRDRHLVLALAALPLAAPGLHAQETGTPGAATLRAGARALSFAVPESGSSELGFWRMDTDRRATGLFVRLDLDHPEQEPGGEGSSVAVGGGPALRRYRRVVDRVAGFGQADLSLDDRYDRGSNGSPSGEHVSTAHGFGGTLGPGLGIGWFPARHR